MFKNNVTRLLDSRKIRYVLHELGTPEKLGAEEVAQRLGIPAGQVYKTLVLGRERKGKPILAIIAADTELNLKALRQTVGDHSLHMATLAEAEQWTGLQTGGITALALLHRGFEIFLEHTAADWPAIIVSAGARGFQIAMSPSDFVEITGAQLLPGISRAPGAESNPPT